MDAVVRFAGADTSRKPSDTVWKQCPWDAIFNGKLDGTIFYDDFASYPITPPTTEGNWGQYPAFTDTGGTMAPPSTIGIGGELAIGSDGDNEGASLRTFPWLRISRTYGQFWFEARVKTSTIADTKHGIFLGLLENTALTATVPIAAAGTLADKNLVGFHRLEGDGDYFDTVYKADGVTQVTVQADAALLVADTYTKLGMHYTPSGDKDGQWVLSFYQDGTRLTTSKVIPSAAGTDFPNDISLGLVFAVLNATASSPGTSTIDWWRAAALSTPAG